MVELSKIQKPENKDVVITVRTTKENKEWMETDLKLDLERRAEKSKLSLCEYCRQQLRPTTKIDRILFTVEKIAQTKDINMGASLQY
jgi:hypothetical protein